MLVNLTCQDFIEELSSSSPAPGGGSVSALAGSLGAALVSMVLNLSLGKKNTDPELQVVLEKAKECVVSLRDYVDQDTEAFNAVMAAYQLPKGTEEQKKIRSEVIQEKVKEAASLPMEVAQCCLEVLKLAKIVVIKGNPNALSDGGVAALMASAGLNGAIYNVQINLGSIKDKEFVHTLESRKDQLLQEEKVLRDEIQAIILAKLAG